MSLPVTPGGMSKYLVGKPETTEILGHVWLSTITWETTRPMGR